MPIAKPIVAEDHNSAVVVKPLTFGLVTMIVPAPRNLSH